MNVLMIGVNKKSVGGMLTVINNYLHNEYFVKKTNLKYISTVSRHNKLVKILKFMYTLPIIFFTILFAKIDIIHVHMAERGSVFREGFIVWLGKHMKRKTIIHLHAAELESWYNNQSYKRKKKIKQIFLNADKIIILGKNWKPFLIRMIGKENENKLEVVYNAVNASHLNPYNNLSKQLLFLGMLIKRKGIEDLIIAFNQALPYIDKDYKLVLYGDDAEKSIHSLLEKYDNSGRISYNGWIGGEEKEEIFKNTICNILPSYNEGLPMSILETMGYGIPNISTNIAAIPEAIDETCGILITPGDVNALKNAIIKICNNEKIRKEYSENSYRIAVEKFGLNTHFNHVLKLYEDLIKNEKNI